MIGDAYFELRTRLGTHLGQLADVVREHGGSGDDAHILKNLIASLNDPFIFVVVGEVNTGKSTFLNALFGADFSRTGIMPTTDKIYFFKHGPEVKSVPVTSTLEEVQVPCDFLKDFHIVDTPGTNSIENEHQQITERFVPSADLVVFVFSAMNPWGASAWQFLEKVHRQWMRQIVFVLQQCDLRTPEEVQLITDYMKQLSMQRFGREFTIFPVSAKKAYLSRSSGIDREKLFAESGFENMERHIDEVVARQPGRLNKLNATLRLAKQILDSLTDQTAAQIRELKERQSLLEEMQRERDVQLQRTQSKFDLVLDATDHDFREAAARIVQLASENLTIKKTFAAVRDDTRIPPNLDHRLNQDLLTHVGERWQHMASTLESDFKRFENYMSHHWRGELYLSELKSKDDSEAASEEARRRFISKVESTLRRFVLGVDINQTLAPGLASSRNQARRFPWIISLLLIASAVVGWFIGWKEGAIAAGATVVIAVLLISLINRTLRQTSAHLVTKLEASRGTLRQMLHDQTRDETDNAFSIFTRIFQPSRVDMDHQAKRLVVQAGKLDELQDSFGKLHRELQGNATTA